VDSCFRALVCKYSMGYGCDWVAPCSLFFPPDWVASQLEAPPELLLSRALMQAPQAPLPQGAAAKALPSIGDTPLALAVMGTMQPEARMGYSASGLFPHTFLPFLPPAISNLPLPRHPLLPSQDLLLALKAILGPQTPHATLQRVLLMGVTGMALNALAPSERPEQRKAWLGSTFDELVAKVGKTTAPLLYGQQDSRHKAAFPFPHDYMRVITTHAGCFPPCLKSSPSPPCLFDCARPSQSAVRPPLPAATSCWRF